MPLAAVQRSFRDIVFHATQEWRPGRRSARAVLRDARGLTANERAALARIPKERIAVYHDLVVGGHQAMMGWTFATTLGVLELVQSAHPRLARPLSLRAMVEAFLLDRPATTHSLRELADRFGDFLRSRFAPAFARYPLIGEVLLAERARLDVDSAVDGPGHPATRADLERLTKGDVDALLRTRVLVPTTARFLRTRHDVAHLWRRLRDRGRPPGNLAEAVVKRRQEIVITREPASLVPQLLELEKGAFADLRAFTPGRAFRLEDLAARRARRFSGSEETRLRAVLTEAVRWLAAGVLVLAAPRGAQSSGKGRSKRTAMT